MFFLNSFIPSIHLELGKLLLLTAPPSNRVQVFTTSSRYVIALRHRATSSRYLRYVIALRHQATSSRYAIALRHRATSSRYLRYVIALPPLRHCATSSRYVITLCHCATSSRYVIALRHRATSSRYGITLRHRATSATSSRVTLSRCHVVLVQSSTSGLMWFWSLRLDRHPGLPVAPGSGRHSGL